MRIKRIASNPQEEESNNLDLNLISPITEKYKGKKGIIIPLLQGTQEIYGFLPRAAMEKIALDCDIELSDLFGVATFYAQFRLHPVGKYIIKVCHGTACHVQNSNAISEAIEEALNVLDGQTTDDGLFTLESVACLGCCSLAPVMMIGDNTFGKLTGSKAVRIIKNIRIAENNNN